MPQWPGMSIARLMSPADPRQSEGGEGGSTAVVRCRLARPPLASRRPPTLPYLTSMVAQDKLMEVMQMLMVLMVPPLKAPLKLQMVRRRKARNKEALWPAHSAMLAAATMMDRGARGPEGATTLKQATS